MTSVGTLMRARSLRKSSCHVGTQARLGSGRCARGDVPAGLDSLFADSGSEELVSVVEVFEKFGEERVTVRGYGFLDPFEDAAVNAFRVVRCLQQIRRD